MPAEADALREAVDWLLARQAAEGWWVGELETNVTMTAEHVLLLRFLALDTDAIRDGAVRHLLRQQRDDGSWALYFEGPADLSTTIEAYAALKVLGVDASSGPMTRALRVIHEQGGVAEARVFTKIWLALFGAYPWRGVPSMPPELVYLPPRIPLNLYDFSCWARGTIAPLLIVLSKRPCRPLGVSLAELVVPGTEAALRRVPGSGVFWWLDKLLKAYERLPWQPGRAGARRRLVDWVVARQEADGSWGGIQPPWVYSLIALDLEGMGLDHPVLRRGLDGLARFALDDEGGWRLQACQSPVWDTAWAVLALRRAGLEQTHPALMRAVDWLLGEQVATGGDWQVRCPARDCGGWSFEFDNDGYPDVDDTALVVLALLEAAPAARVAGAVERALRWVLAMRSSNGAWAAFDRDNTSQLAYKLPFADFGALTDPPTEDVTAHVVEMLAALGHGPTDPYVASALAFLRRTQQAGGSWYGRWGVNHLYGTWCAMTALARLGAGEDMLERGVAWLLSMQNPDGGWGETCHSYDDGSFAGVGRSTPSQTAWAVLSLQAVGRQDLPACRRGLDYLLAQQRHGTWEEPEYTGTGFPGDFYINYHLYRHLFPTLALATSAPLAPAARQARDLVGSASSSSEEAR
jgi:squalene-hopene/tetraprenyl-beta-curcumene cyclase